MPRVTPRLPVRWKADLDIGKNLEAGPREITWWGRIGCWVAVASLVGRD